MPEKFSVVGGGLLDFKVYLSPLPGEGDWSRIERFRERVREMSREGSERGRERKREERREGRGDRLRQFIQTGTRNYVNQTNILINVNY